ncbi:MAG: hypothetical protein ACPKQO_04895 [Nitrososphaeraceae archaeon]
MKSILILLPVVLVMFSVGSVYGQNWESLIGITEEEAISIVEKNTKHMDRLADITVQCTNYLSIEDYNSFRQCMEFQKQYNQVMTDLFLQNKEFIDKILY